MDTLTLNGFKPDLGELKRARKGKITHHKCACLSGEIKNLSYRVLHSWDSFSEEEKNELKDLAYALVDSPRPSFFSRLYTWIRLFQARKEGYYSGLVMLIESIDILVDNIFSSIERECLAEACDELNLFT